MITSAWHRWLWLVIWMAVIAVAHCNSACGRQPIAPAPSEQLAAERVQMATCVTRIELEALRVDMLEQEHARDLVLAGLQDDVAAQADTRKHSEATWCALLLHVERPHNQIPIHGPWADFSRCSCGHGARCNMTREGSNWRRQ